MIFVPHLHSNKGLSFEDREMFKKQHQEIMNEFKESNNLLNDIKPNEYELEIKELNNLNKQLKEENYKLINNVKDLDKMVEDLIGYISQIDEVREAGGVKIECREIKDFSLGQISFEEIIIPQLRLLKRKSDKE